MGDETYGTADSGPRVLQLYHQQYCAAGLLRPLTDKYAFTTDKRIISISQQKDSAIT